MKVKLYKFNPKPSPWWCSSCGDSGKIEICHPSTDGLIGWAKCENHTPYPVVYKWPYDWKLTPSELTARRLESDRCPF